MSRGSHRSPPHFMMRPLLGSGKLCRRMHPWDVFKAAVPWFVRDEQVVRADAARAPGAWQPRSHEFSRLFPRLDSLLRQAHIADITVDDKSFMLFSWAVDGSASGWLCEPPTDAPPAGVCSAHDVLLRSFGGIVER